MRLRIFDLLWRLAILAPPWQTRWFADATLTGWPWEQGRISMYVSWILLAVTIVFGWMVRVRSLKRQAASRLTWFTSVMTGFVVIASFIITGSDEPALKAALQWWIQIGLLFGFGYTVFRASISKRQVATWMVIALLPHVALGFWQYAIQAVIGHSWLGMATQLPENLGVSVVEHGVYRLLRMYGGFPHPNIFGGWSAIGLFLSVWLAARAGPKWRALGWSFAAAAISIGLLLSYARSAWIGVVVGAVAFVVLLTLKTWSWRPSNSEEVEGTERHYTLVAIGLSLLAMLIVAIPERDHLLSRFDRTQRLEAKSLETRSVSLKTGIDIFQRHPIFGTGPNAELLDVATNLGNPVKTVAPLEPPHNVYVLALANLGFVGFSVLLFIFGMLLRLIWQQPNRNLSLSLLVVLAVIGLFDHYLWSLWAGQVLAAEVLLLSVLPKVKTPFREDI